MGRLIRLRKASPLREVEETIAALHEELELTLHFAHAMVREENYRAAAEVIDEQRRSLARAGARLESALRAPEAPRSGLPRRAALAGIAAVLMLGSGAFAAFRQISPPVARPPIRSIEEAGQALEAATRISDPVALSQLVVPAQEEILAAARRIGARPQDKAKLLDTVEKLKRVLENPNLPETLRQRAHEVAEQVHEMVVTVPEEIEETTEDAGTIEREAGRDAGSATAEDPAETGTPSAPAAPQG